MPNYVVCVAIQPTLPSNGIALPLDWHDASEVLVARTFYQTGLIMQIFTSLPQIYHIVKER